MKKTLIINFYGGPGSGKSTTAARIFSELKDKGYNVELVTEYAKDLTWQKSFHVLGNQVYIFAKQQHRIWRLDGMVDMIITDSPLLNSLVYGDTTETFKSLVIEEYWKRPTFDIYLNRVKEYNPAGRSQKLEEAIEIDRITTRRVEEIKEFDLMVDGEKASTEKIMDAVLIKYKELAKY
jgi:molybdopterin-guanine dinucleotide biosynthesis protein